MTDFSVGAKVQIHPPRKPFFRSYFEPCIFYPYRNVNILKTALVRHYDVLKIPLRLEPLVPKTLHMCQSSLTSRLDLNRGGGGAKTGVTNSSAARVSNERFSAEVKLRCKLDIHTALLSPPVYLRRRVGLQCFQGVT